MASPIRWVGAVAAVLVVVSMLASAGGSAASAPSAAPPSATVSAAPLTAAVASLEHGQGPAAGAPARCDIASTVAATCGRLGGPADRPGGESARPLGAADSLAFYNVSAGASLDGANSPAADYSGMAYDPQLGLVVLYDGCSPTECPQASTWVYNGYYWTNLTPLLSAAPSARWAPSMDWDPGIDAIVLVGGQTNLWIDQDTWTFGAEGWTNISSTVGALPYPVWGAGLTWDPQSDGMLLADGCTNLPGTTSADYTAVLKAGAWQSAGAGPGSASGTAMCLGSLAYDAADQYALWFGGYDEYADFENYTYTYTPTAGWTNITLNDGGCFIVCGWTPAGRDSGGLTWDAQANMILLVGGYNGSDTAAPYDNDTWSFQAGAWLPADLSAANSYLPPSGFAPNGAPVVPDNSTGIPAFILGGACVVACANDEWAWEIAPQPFIRHASFNPVDEGAVVTVQASFVAPSGAGPNVSWEVEWGDGSYTYTTVNASTQSAYNVTFTHTYAAAATYTVNVSEDDFFYVFGWNSSYSLSVIGNMSATITASKTTVDAGQAVDFTSVVTGGLSPYAYSWNFGDGSPTSSAQNPTHTYSGSGTQIVTFTATDSAGGTIHRTVSIAVNAAVTASASATPTTVAPGATVSFTATGGGGTGTYTYAWRFGDGGSSAVQDPTHSYATAGTYTATLWVNDSLGGSATSTVSVDVKSSSSSSGSSSIGGLGITDWIIIGVVIVVVAALLAVLLGRRKKTAPMTPYTPPGTPPPTSGAPPPGAGGGPPPGAS
jgi:PKD repeat protein